MSWRPFPVMLNALGRTSASVEWPGFGSRHSGGSGSSAGTLIVLRSDGIGLHKEKECATGVRNTAEVRTALGTMGRITGVRVTGLDNRTGEASVVNESGAWLEFVGQCHAAIERLEQGALEPRVTSTLLAAATRLQTRTARVLALTMISRVAGRISTAIPMSIPLSVSHSDDRLPEPPVNSRVATVLEYHRREPLPLIVSPGRSGANAASVAILSEQARPSRNGTDFQPSSTACPHEHRRAPAASQLPQREGDLGCDRVRARAQFRSPVPEALPDDARRVQTRNPDLSSGPFRLRTAWGFAAIRRVHRYCTVGHERVYTSR